MTYSSGPCAVWHALCLTLSVGGSSLNAVAFHCSSRWQSSILANGPPQADNPAMDKQLLIFYGMPALGGMLALLFFFLSIRAGRRQRLISDLPTSKTTGVFIGLVELKLMAHPSG